MADDSDLVSKITIEGAEESTKAIEDYADKGAEAFDKLGEAAQKSSDEVSKSTEEIDKSVSKSSDGVQKSTKRASDAFRDYGLSAKEVASGSRVAQAGFNQLEQASARMGRAIQQNVRVLATFAARVATMAAGAGAAGVGVLKLAQNVAKAASTTKNGLDEQTKSQIAANNASLAAEQRAIGYENAQAKLLDQLRTGTIDYEAYSKAAYSLRQEYQQQERTARRVAAAQDEVNKQNEKLQQQAADRAAYQKLADTYGNTLAQSLIQLGNTVQTVSEKFRDAFGPAAASVADLINNLIQQNLPAIQQFAQQAAQQIQQFVSQNAPGITQAFTSISQAAGSVFTSLIQNAPMILNLFNNQIVPAVQAFYNAVKSALDQFNSLFGTNLTPGMIALLAVLLRLTGGFQLLWATIKTGANIIVVVSTALGMANTQGITFLGFLRMVPALFGPWGAILAALAAGLTALYFAVDWKKFGADVQGFVENFAKWFSDLPTRVNDSIQSMVNSVDSTVQGWIDTVISYLGKIYDWFAALPGKVVQIFTDIGQAIMDAFKGAFDAVTSTVSGWVQSLIGLLQPVVDMIKFILGNANSAANSGGGGGGDGFAGGGRVRGPGTSTSDSIRAWLSNNEFVMRARAVRKYGVGLMHAINQGRLDFSAPLQFARGGLVNVGGPSFNYAGGGDNSGASSAMRPFSLNLGDQEFGGLLAPEAVADQMVNYAIQRRIRSAGRKPSWVGG